jgi:uncharacterized protein YjbI with pentapeptide repeats
MKRTIATAASALALGALSLLALAPAASAQGQGPEGELQSPTEQQIGLLFVQTAKRGTLQRVRGRPGSFKLKLGGISRQMVWFQDHPGRHSGHLAVGSFVRAWAGFGFAETRPNAALTLLDGHRGADTAVFRLSRPRYRPKQRTIRYLARRLSEAEGNLSHFEHRRDRRLPRRFRAASLFIDDAQGQVINGCVIQPYTQCPRAELTWADLAGADLTGADLTGASINGAKLTGAALTGAELAGVNFNYSNLTDANLGKANLKEATLQGAKLTGATLTGADLSSAEIGYADLANANLTDAILWKAGLLDTDLTGAKLAGADLRWALLWKADFLGADLTGANLNFAYFCETRMPEGWINNASCYS